MTAVAFELGISLGEVTKVQMVYADVPALDDVYTWFVRVGPDDVVEIHALYNGKVREIGRATWSQFGRLVDRTSTKPQFPNAHQWKLVATALGRIQRRALAGMPAWRRVLASIDPTARRILIGAIVVGFLAIGVVVTIFVVRTKDPVSSGLAPYAKLLWADVDGGGETTIPLILKDPDRERGRKLCVTATVADIERTTIDGRDVHAGTLRMTTGDAVRFIALGSTRSVISRYAGTFCGVANGKAVVGLFDLPENRSIER